MEQLQCKATDLITASSRIEKRGSVTYSYISSDDDECSSECHLPLDIAGMIVNRTEKRLQDILSSSQFVKLHSKVEDLPRFAAEEFEIGERVGRGGFSCIHAINFVNEDDNKCLVDGDTDDDIEAGKRFVVKHLNPKLVTNPKRLLGGMRDLVKEAHFLSSLSHEHILRMRGCSTGGLSDITSSGKVEGYFLVLDRLEITLFHQVLSWSEKEVNELRKVRYSDSARSFYHMRLSIARDIASAIAYLHERNIVHMDIKSGNIGFDKSGCVKLFDFGLANELPHSDDPDDVFDHANKTGTPRFMSPEIILKEPYNCKVDVFSFSIVLWEMMALEKPYGSIDAESVKEVVSVFDERPKIPRSWPYKLRELLRKSWSRRISKRFCMREVHCTLVNMMESLQMKNKRRASIFRRKDKNLKD